MKYAVLLFQNSPTNPDNWPGYWPARQAVIKDSEIQMYVQQNWTIFTPEEYEAYLATHQGSFDLWFANYAAGDVSKRIRVLDLVDDKFKGYHPSKIDFRLHLRADITLKKTVTMLKNGRPSKAEYSYEGEKIAEITFEFTADAFNFMTRRREILGYVSKDGNIYTTWAIADQSYVHTDPYQMRERVKERKDARENIFSEIKSKIDVFLAGYYLAQSPPWTYAQILTLGGEFWMAYSNRIDAWINTGTPALKTSIQNDTEFDFFNLTMPAALIGSETDMTVREYVTDRLTYQGQ